MKYELKKLNKVHSIWQVDTLSGITCLKQVEPRPRASPPTTCLGRHVHEAARLPCKVKQRQVLATQAGRGKLGLLFWIQIQMLLHRIQAFRIQVHLLLLLLLLLLPRCRACPSGQQDAPLLLQLAATLLRSLRGLTTGWLGHPHLGGGGKGGVSSRVWVVMWVVMGDWAGSDCSQEAQRGGRGLETH